MSTTKHNILFIKDNNLKIHDPIPIKSVLLEIIKHSNVKTEYIAN